MWNEICVEIFKKNTALNILDIAPVSSANKINTIILFINRTIIWKNITQICKHQSAKIKQQTSKCKQSANIKVKLLKYKQALSITFMRTTYNYNNNAL